ALAGGRRVVTAIPLAVVAGTGHAVESVVVEGLAGFADPIVFGAGGVHDGVIIVAVGIADGVGRARGKTAALSILAWAGATVGPHVLEPFPPIDEDRLAEVAFAVAVQVHRQPHGHEFGVGVTRIVDAGPD